MKKLVVVVVMLSCIILLSFTKNPSGSFSVSKKAPDSLADERDKIVRHLLDSLKGKESMPADSIFSNLQLFTSSHRLKVSHLLAVMNYWGEALGVKCNYCHSSGEWASDSFKTKRIAREMYNLRQTINAQILKIPDIDPKLAQTNCTTCHNGSVLTRK